MAGRRGRGLPGLRGRLRAAAVPRLAGQRPGRRQHRAAGAGAGDPVLAATAPTRWPPTPSSSAAWSRPSSAPSTTTRSTTCSAGSPTRPRRSRPTARCWPRSTARSATYASAIAQARDNNRQGFPVGAEYLLQARATLRGRGSTDHPGAGRRQLRARRGRDVRASTRSGSSGSALAALAALWWVNRQIARRFHRRLNVGLAVAAVAVAVLTVVATFARPGPERRQRRAASTAATSRRPTRPTARTAGQRREGQREPAADQARVGSTLRGRSGSPPRNRSTSRRPDRRTSSGSGTPRCTTRSSTLDSGGNWDAAVGMATTRDDAGGVRGPRPVDALRRRARSTGPPRRPPTTLRSGNAACLVLAAATLLLGLIAAATCRLGHQPATEGVRMRRLVGAVAASVVLLAGCGGVRRHRGPGAGPGARGGAAGPRRPVSVRRPPPTSYAAGRLGRRPPRRRPRRDPRARSADRRRLGRHLPARRPATRSPARSRASTSTWSTPIAAAIFGTASGHVAAARDHRRRPDPAARGRRDRHRGAQHDDQLRRAGSRSRSRRSTTGPARRSWCARTCRTRQPGRHGRGAGRPAGLRARPAPPASRTSSEAPDATGRHRHQPHRLPGEVPATARPTRSPATTPCWPGSPPRTRTPWCRSRSAFTEEPYGIGVNADNARPGRASSTRCSSEMRGRRVVAGQLRHAGSSPTLGEGDRPAPAGLRPRSHDRRTRRPGRDRPGHRAGRDPGLPARPRRLGAGPPRTSSTSSTRPPSRPAAGPRSPPT